MKPSWIRAPNDGPRLFLTGPIRTLDAKGQALGKRPEHHFVNNTESLIELVVAAVGYGVLTSEFARPYLAHGCLVAGPKG